MMAQSSSWKGLAEKKRDAIFNSIPAKWHIEKSKLPSNEEQRDVTGYVQQFLSKREIEITETDVLGIFKETSSGNWTAAEVAEAFCHRASLAHQLVSDGKLRPTILISYSSYVFNGGVKHVTPMSSSLRFRALFNPILTV